MSDPVKCFDSQLAIFEKLAQLDSEIWTNFLPQIHWNDLFGPKQLNHTIKLVSIENTTKRSLKNTLKENFPNVKIFISSLEKQSYLFTRPLSIQEFSQYPPVNFLYGINIRNINGDLNNIIPENFNTGYLNYNDSLLSLCTPFAIEKVKLDCVKLTYHTIQQYPGLCVTGELRNDLINYYPFCSNYLNEFPCKVFSQWNEIYSDILTKEKSILCKKKKEIEKENEKPEWCHFTTSQLEPARKIIEFYRTSDKTCQILQDHHIEINYWKTEICPIRQNLHQNELEYFLSETSDYVFRSWFLYQTESHENSYLSSILDYSLFEKFNKTNGIQKATHQGWSLRSHMIEVVYLVETDEIVNEDYDFITSNEIRLSLRLAALFHDVGKLIDIYTPGYHADLGRNLWNKFKPNWITEKNSKLIGWLICNHDIYGRLARGLTEKEEYTNSISDINFDFKRKSSYSGSLSPKQVIKKLLLSGFPLLFSMKLNNIIWKSDLGSISSLRWLLPIVPLLNELILNDEENSV